MTTAPNGTRPTAGLLQWALFFGNGGGAAGCGLALIELAAGPPVGSATLIAITILYATGLGVLLGLIAASAAAGVALLARILNGDRAPTFMSRGVIVLGVLLFALIEGLNRTTFDGPRISSHEHITLIRIGFHALAAAASWVAARLLFTLSRWRTAESFPRLAIAAALVGIATALCWADRTLLVGHYPQLHLQLTLAFLLSSLLALGLLVRTHRALPLIALTALAILAAPLRRSESIHAARAWIESQTIQLRGISTFGEDILALATAIPTRRNDVTDTILDHARAIDHDAIAAKLDELIPKRRDLSLLIVSLDTLRTDHVGAFGYDKNPTTPVLDRMATRSIRFHNCYTAYPTSSPSYSSFFTGRFPSCAPVDWVWGGDEPSWPKTLTLAGMLASKGFQTRAETAFNRGTLSRRDIFGHLIDGFQVFNPDRTIEARSAPAVTAAAIGHLKELVDQKFFLWVHYLDIHEPYRTHDAFPFGEDSQSRYDSEIAWTDDHVGRVLAQLDAQGAADNTIVCIMSDHGEEFGEHNSRFHNTNLYEQQARVPCVLHIPGLHAIDTHAVVSLTDMMPTLIELMGIDDPHRRSGRSLWPEILGLKSPDGSFAFAEFSGQKSVLQGAKKMVVHGRHKLIFSERSQTEEIYDLRDDPQEQVNLIGQLGTRGDALRALLRAIESDIAEIRLEANPDEVAALSPQDDLRQRMATILAQPKAKQTVTLPLFVRNLADGIFGVKHNYAAALRGESREEAISFGLQVFDDRDPNIALSILELFHVMRAHESIRFLQGVDSLHPLIRSKTAALRGLFGDQSALTELRGIYKFEGVPNKHDIAIAMMMLGDETGIDRIRAALWTRSPLRTTEAIQSLRHGNPDTLLQLSSQFFTHAYWQYAPIRQAMAQGLIEMRSSALRDRLLARLTFDGEGSIAASALSALKSTHDNATLKLLLRAGEAEVDGDQAIAARKFGVAQKALHRAKLAWPDLHESLQVKLGALEFFHGDKARAYDIIRELRPELADLWLHALRSSTSFLQHTPSFEATFVSGDRAVLRNQWNAAVVSVRNRGAEPWLASTCGQTVRFKVVITDKDGKELPTLMEQTAEIIGMPVAVNGSARLTLPYMTPRSSGIFTLSVIMEVIAADGGVRTSGKPVPFGKLQVKDRLM